jgi:hypothetical protein
MGGPSEARSPIDIARRQSAGQLLLLGHADI